MPRMLDDPPAPKVSPKVSPKVPQRPKRVQPRRPGALGPLLTHRRPRVTVHNVTMRPATVIDQAIFDQEQRRLARKKRTGPLLPRP